MNGGVNLSDVLTQGATRHQAGDLRGAAQRYEAVLAFDPAQADALHLRGVAERHVGPPARGFRMIGRADRLRPGDAAIRRNFANARLHLLQHAALAYQDQDFATLLADAQALAQYGGLDQDDAMRPELAGMLNNAAHVLNERAESDLGRRCIELAWRLAPSVAVHTHLLILRLAQQDYRAAWDPALWRAVARGASWAGAPHPGTLVVTNRNGAGDLFQFMRFIPHARRRVGRLVLLARREMARLMRWSPLLEGVDILSEDPNDPDSVYCEVFALPAAMGLDETHVPVDGGYLLPPADRVADWRRALRGDDPRPHVGVAWSHWTTEDPRSPGYGFFHDLIAARPDAVFVGIHAAFGKHDLRNGEFPDNFRFFGPTDLPTTACILKSLDWMIAPCGGMAHLSGALGLPAWVALRRWCDWRWRFFDGRYDWYPNTRLFHQTTEGDWAGLQRRIAVELDRRIAAAQQEVSRVLV